MNIQKLHSLFLECNSVSTDTRKIETNDLFFALKGDNFNGNEFANQAIQNGAKYAIIDEKKYAINDSYILVNNVLNTLQELASYHRSYLGIKIIGLTGSNGKTTTKELINTVLSQKYKTVATKGNLNNHIGVPLTLLSMSKTTEIGIVEMGANHQKEIAFLSSIAKPDFGLITNFGKAHLEGFGGVEGVIKGKSELYDYLIKNDKHIFFNADDPIQNEKLNTYFSKIGFSKSNKSDYNISLLKSKPFINLKIKNTKITSNLIGEYNFTNISNAVMIGAYFNVDLEFVKNAIEGYMPSNNRSQIIEKGFNKIILDAYNANPTSMVAAIDNFSSTDDINKIAILGDMFELGESAKSEHQYIAEYALNSEINNLFLVGENFNGIYINDTKCIIFKSFDTLKNHIENNKYENVSFLIKGSRGMALERILDYI